MVAHFPSASVSALGDLSDTSASYESSDSPGPLLILAAVRCRAVMSWRSRWLCGTAINQEPSGARRLGHDQLGSDSALA